MGEIIIILVLFEYVQLLSIDDFSVGFLSFFFLPECFPFDDFTSIVHFSIEKLIFTLLTCKSFLVLKILPLRLLICYNFPSSLSFYV